jgi:3-oxoacyl-(acyl-carrier-protein) synthase
MKKEEPTSPNSRGDERICAVLAADAVTALGAGAENIWAAMAAGACGIRPLRRLPRDRYQTAVAGEVPATAEAALAAELPAPSASRAWRLAFGVGRRTLDGAAGAVAAGRTGLVLATTKADIEEFERRGEKGVRPLLCLAPEGPSRQKGSDPFFSQGPGWFLPDVLARDLAAALGLGGPVLAVSNACASGLVAVAQAARLLERGAAEAVLVVGVDVLADFLLAGFSSLAALSPRPCRPFDRDRDGLSLGEGAGALLLGGVKGSGPFTRPAEPGRPEGCSAVKGPDPFSTPRLGTVRGWGVANDANHITGPSRTGEGLKLAFARALAGAGLAPGDVGAVNSHGTGTLYNDEMEAQALAAVFGERQPPVFSLKGYFGHTLGAAGVIEAVMCLAALRERTVPASLGFENLGVTKPVAVAAEPLALPALDNLVTVKCGFGGVNAAVVLGR